MQRSKQALLSLLLLTAACAGTIARENALLPALRGAWAGIKVQVERELAITPDATATAAVVAADAALQSGDAVAVVAVDWPRIEALAEADIVRRMVAGQIGPGVAVSLRGRLAEFAEARALYTRNPR